MAGTSKVLVLEGQVAPNHKIDDLGVRVPYQETVEVHYGRARWSSDLAHALTEGMVEKVGEKVIRRPSRAKPPRPSASNRQSPSPPSTVSESNSKSGVASVPPETLNTTSEQADASSSESHDQSSKDSDQLEELRSINRQLAEKVETMSERQEELLETLEHVVKQGGVPAQPTETASNQSAPSSASDASDDRDSSVFLPETIRDDDEGGDQKVQAEQDQREVDPDFEKAREALKALEKKQQSSQN